ncbi:uncharacterized protein LY89DRAFT_320009 [Mollisia scopiformis]|uniref:Uncharacterized protein n=1 Tax=Mollisia scopiformis TaxID=149040 RepID=A0A132B9Q0_MOLSC|nr:uncharacterized protein LY89DRAFT_320009 [Mollisia scopiformis]KUJ09101.1 hypothetical protein LY89DRAFT_320009 [Mollisia scopiformis]
MSSNAGIPIYGQLSDNHTSSLNAQYAPNNIPTPWPLLTLSVILSFLIGLLAIVPAMKSLDTQSAPALAPIPLQPTTAGASGSKTKTQLLHLPRHLRSARNRQKLPR